jgi:Susd and RagB outer membrane lipoprotein
MIKYIKITSLSLALLIGVSCTDNFEKLNINSNAPTLDDPAVATAAADALFSASISNGLMRSFEFQRVQSLYADLYAQYFATSINYFASDRYQVNQAWLNAGWNLFYPRDINNLVTIIKSPNASKNQKLIARVWKVFLFHRMVDFYGDIPYFNAAEPDKPEVYDSQQVIYDDMFKELKAASDGLDLTVATSYSTTKDVIYAGNTAKWKAFANTLRMRLAMRISKADPARAKKEFEEAMAAGGLASNADIAQAKVNADQRNALNQITDFNEFRMGATSESILNGFEDPRLPVFFRPAVGGTGISAAYTGKYNGIQNGLNPGDLTQSENLSSNNSNVGVNYGTATSATNPRVCLTYAEHCFLMAEAVLNGWAVTGSAKEWYDRGVTASMQQYTTVAASAITAYLNSAKIPMTPVGLSRPISTLSPNFSSVASEQREQIGIQKWIALYPDGFEAWSEFRRTGFPKLYPPANYDPSSDVKSGDFIQRLPYTDDMRNRNINGVKSAESRMGGAGQAVKLWFAGGK